MQSRNFGRSADLAIGFKRGVISRFMDQPPALPHPKTTIERLLLMLTEGKIVAIRQRKADIQKDFMIGRRILTETYSDLEPEDLPVDLQRLCRDLAITRDQKIADACEEVEHFFTVASLIVESVADTHPALYRAPPKPKPVLSAPADTPARVAKHLTGADMGAIAKALGDAPDGLSLISVCDKLQLTTPSAHMGAKRFLGWLRTSGYVKAQGPGGKGLRYVPTKTMSKFFEKLKASEATGD